MTDTEPTDTDLLTFAIFGLYQDRSSPTVLQAVDHADARRQYHDRFPGWAGTTLHVKELSELIELEPVDD